MKNSEIILGKTIKLVLPHTLLILLTFLTSCAPGTIPAPTAKTTATVVPTATMAPTVTSTPALLAIPTATNILTATQSSPTRPTSLINERLDAVIASYRELGNYPFTEVEVEKIYQAVELVQINDQTLGLARYYWMISESKLNELQEPDLLDMLGYIPLAYSEDGQNWREPTLKDTTNIPLGAQFAQQENGSAEVISENFDFVIVTSAWNVTTFKGESVFDFLTVNIDGSVVLNAEKLGWGGNEDYQISEALKYLSDGVKDFDESGYGRKVYLSHLIDPGSAPTDFDKLTRDQAISVLQQYIKTMVEMYKDKVFAYSVVNEFGQNDVLWRVIGSDYIDIAFKAVREADPTALTILNIQENHVNRGEVRIEGRTIAEETRIIAERLHSEGVIDYVGSQCHIELFPLSPHDETLIEVEEVFSSYPVPVIITELDVNMQEYAEEPDAYLIQAKKIETILQAAADSENVKAIIFWGDFPDNKSWIETMLGVVDANATPWSDTWQEKPMFFTAASVLLRDYIATNQIGQ